MDVIPPLKAHPQGGFTLVELVTVIILVGILGAIVLPRLVGPSAFSQRAGVDHALSGIRHAQQQAMSRSVPVRFDYGGKEYAVEYRNPATGSWEPVSARSPWQLPGGTGFSGSGTLRFNTEGGLEGSPCPRKIEVGESITVNCLTGYARAS